MILHSMFIGRKIQGYYSVQNASISQRRTLQMIRRSPTADERRIYVLPQHCENILLVSNQASLIRHYRISHALPVQFYFHFLLSVFTSIRLRNSGVQFTKTTNQIAYLFHKQQYHIISVLNARHYHIADACLRYAF